MIVKNLQRWYGKRKCKDCDTRFIMRNGIQSRCFDCAKKRKLFTAKMYAQKHPEATKRNHKRWRKMGIKKLCVICNSEYRKQRCIPSKFCSPKCSSISQKKKFAKEGNPNYKNGFYCIKSKKKLMQYLNYLPWRIGKIIQKKMLIESGFIYCQYCKSSNSLYFDTHHIVYRSEAPKHKNLHDKNNLILLCRKCHFSFHQNKPKRNPLIQERKLWTLFPEYLKRFST